MKRNPPAVQQSSSRASARALVLLLSIQLLSASGALAQEAKPWDGPAFQAKAAELLKAAEQVSSGDADVVVLLEEEHYDMDIGREQRTTRVVFKIMTAAGAENWSAVVTDWSPWREQKPAIRARVITPDGQEHWLDPATLADEPADDDGNRTFADRRSLRGPLPAVRVGAVVEEVFVSDAKPFFEAGTVTRVYLGRSTAPVERTRVVVTAPTAVPLRHLELLLPGVKNERQEASGRVELRFEHGRFEKIEPGEPYRRDDLVTWPQVAFSTGQTWAEVARRYHEVVESRLAGRALKETVAKAIRGEQTRDEKIASLMAAMHSDVRYTGVEFGEAALVPQTPAETLKRRYGDCKDKAALLMGMLREAGIPSHMALLATLREPEPLAELPGLGEFDHAIVYVPGTPELWIDATAEYAPLGELPSGDYDRPALLISPSTTGLVRTPQAPAGSSRLVEEREFWLAEVGKARVIETSEAHGPIGQYYREEYGAADEKPVREQMEKYVKETYLAEKLAGMERGKPRDFAQPFRIRLEATGAGRGVSTSDGAVVAVTVRDIFSRLPEELREEDANHKARKSDFVLRETFATEWRYRIVPPPGFKARPLPKDEVRKLGPAQLSQSYREEPGGEVTANLRLDVLKPRMTAAEAEELRAGVLEVKKTSGAVLLHFDQAGETHLQAGRIREALAAFRGLAAQHPKEALHRTQVARTLLAAGMGEAAREEARQATAVEPASAQAYRTLGWVLQHDLVGRRLRRGYDRAGAVAAYRKAVELDKEDAAIRADLAILLEYDEYGKRYGSKEGMEAALVEYTAVKDKLASLGLEENPIYTLLYLERFAEVKKETEGGSSSRKKSLRLAAVAAEEGVAAALAESVKLGSEAPASLQGAAQQLTGLRRYAEAAELMAAGARGGGAEAAQQMQRAQVLKMTRRREEILPGRDNPRRPAYLMFAALFSREPVREEFFDLLSRHAQPDKASMEKELTKLRATQQQTGATASRSGMDPETLGDLVLSLMQITQEGNDADGYRLRTQMPGVPQATFFVVREDGEYRLLDAAMGANKSEGGELSGIGALALHLVEKGELERARKWLDWARENQQPAGGDDVFAGGAFPRLWSVGQAADAKTMRIAAAALIQEPYLSSPSRALLQEAGKAATSEEERTRIDAALAAASLKANQPEALLEISGRLLKVSPKSGQAFRWYRAAAERLGRWKELETAIQERLRLLPDDADALRAQAMAASLQGNHRGAVEVMRKLESVGKAEAEDLNQAAWEALFLPPVGEEAVQRARRAAVLTQNANGGVLHTLACVYAAMGNTTEGRQLLLQSMDLMGVDEPNPPIWYGLGRLAEEYGMKEAAITAYQRTKPPEPEEKYATAISSYALAQMRLKALGEPGKGR